MFQRLRKLLISSTPQLLCGTGIFISKKEKTLLPACIIHDRNYDRFGPTITRKEADKIFLNHMLSLSHNFCDKVRAYRYYFLVRIFG